MEAELELHILYDRPAIRATVKRLAREITRDYRGRQPVLLGVLKGSFVFLADLVRLLDFPMQVEFVQLSSYGTGSRTSGEVRVLKDLSCPIEGRDVLVVEDIVDTGLTTTFILRYLREKRPASLRLCSLIDKPSRRQVPVAIDYRGFTVPNKFVVGYGIDYDEKFRNLPVIGYLEGE